MIARAGLSILAWLTLAYLVFPLVVILGASLTASEFLAFPPRGTTLAWYGRVVSDASYLAAFWTSTWLAALAALCAVLLGLPAALAIARHDFPGKAAMAALLMSPLLLPHIVLGAALLQYCVHIGIARTPLALLVGHSVVVVPFVIRAVLPLLTPGQRALEEASMDLGAGPFSTFCRVTLPLVRGGVISGALFAFISSWINVELSMFGTTAAMTTVPVKLLNHVQYQVDPLIAAVSGITILAAAAAIIAIDLIFGLDLLAERK
jgi:putative spermidine/putrescine transport system permease protein